MIKKLSLLTILCFMSIISADELSDAIRHSDAQRVSALLSRTVLTEKQLNKYLDIADHVINARQDQLNEKRTQTHYMPSKATGRSACAILLCLASGVGAGIMHERSYTYYYRDMYSKIAGCSFIGFMVSTFAAVLFDGMDRSRAHSGALRIKELLHDYEVPSMEPAISATTE